MLPTRWTLSGIMASTPRASLVVAGPRIKSGAGLSRPSRLIWHGRAQGSGMPGSSPGMGTQSLYDVLLHHLFGRKDSPQVRSGRILGPHLRLLRPVAVPGARLEIAEFLVHAVELGEQLGDQPVGRAVVGEQVVADAVPPRPPQQLVAVETEIVAGGLQVTPVAQLERGVEVPVGA